MKRTFTTLVSKSLLLGSLLLLGCAGSAQNAAPRAPLRELPASATSLLSLAPPIYGASALPGPIPGDTGSAAAQAAFASAVPGGADGSLKHDAALDLVAAILAQSYAERQQTPVDSLVSWLFWRAGATSMPARYDVFAADEGTPVEVFNQRLSEVASMVSTKPIPLAFGVTRMTWSGIAIQAVVIGRRAIDVAPMSKSFAPGSTVTIEGRLGVPYSDPKLYVDEPKESVRVEALTPGEGGTVKATLQVPNEPGRYFIELLGAEPRNNPSDPPWHHTLLWLPIYVGVAEPSLVDEFIRQPKPNPPPDAWKTQILGAYNAERYRLGRPPLFLDERATGLAQERAEQIAQAPGKPQADPAIVERLATAGVVPRDVFDLLSSVEFVSEYLHMRLLHPSMRHALLSPNTTVLGVGVAPRTSASGWRSFATVEYAVEPVPPFDRDKDRARVHAEMDALEAAEGRPALGVDDALTKAAQAMAEEVCKGARKPSEVKDVWAQVGSAGKDFLHRGSFAWSGYDFSKEEIGRVHEAMKGNGYTRAGVGLCQGTVDGRANSVYVLMLQMGP